MTSPDRTLGGYLIGPTLGEGGFSKVKLGIDPDTNERVALKILKKNAMTLSEKQRKQVELEIAAMQGIDHVNVVRLHSVDWHAKYTKRNGRVLDVVLVVLELATGGELFDFLSFTGNFSEPIARTYFHQLCAGLRACRDAGIAHRDLKPENLLLGKDFLLKIADFGFARTTSDDALLYSKCGTTGYMAPEMFTGKGYDGFKSDMWSAGVILFIMLAGFPPFQRADMSDWWFNKLSRGKHSLFWKAHRRSCEFSDGFMDLINKILAPDPAERASLEDVMSHPWFTSGDTLSQEELVAEFSRRKAIVEQEKAREAMAAGSSGTRDASSDISSSGAHRSLGDDDDADDTLPHRPPRMLSQLRLDGLDEDGADEEEPESRLLDADADAQDPTDVPPVFDAKLSVPCYTRFYSKSQPSQLRSALSSAFAQMKAQHSVDGFRIKASVATEAGFVSVVCQLFELTECQSSDVFLCQVRRLDGDGLHFRLFYDDLISRVGDFVCLPPDTDVEV